MVNLLPYDISESPDGGVRFQRRRLGWDDALLALRRPGLGAFVGVCAVAFYFANQAEESHRLIFGIEPASVMLGIATVFFGVGFGLAYIIYRRAATSFVFDHDRGVLRIGRGREIPFSKLDGAYCVRDRGAYTDEAGSPIETFEVYVRSGERRIPLAVFEDRYAGDRLADTLQRLISLKQG